MTLVILLTLLAILLLAVEVFLLPGITVAGIGAFVAAGFAIFAAFTDLGTTGGIITMLAILLLSVAVLAIGLRARTWKRFTLDANIDGTAQRHPEEELSIGARGTAITRLAPMGKVRINGHIYEAKSTDAYIDQQTAIEVIGFDNFSIVVQPADSGPAAAE